MNEAIIITPVKDSIETTLLTINSVSKAVGDFQYFIYDDFSNPNNSSLLKKEVQTKGHQYVHVEDLAGEKSPNYDVVLQHAQKVALSKNAPLIIVESDVIVTENTFQQLIATAKQVGNFGLIGAITVDQNRSYNFPYAFISETDPALLDTKKSISFCCTLISNEFLQRYSFHELPKNKDWFDVYISKKSKSLGFSNFIAKNIEVVHLPHSSRPWKMQKYSNPILYYLKKYVYKRDRI